MPSVLEKINEINDSIQRMDYAKKILEKLLENEIELAPSIEIENGNYISLEWKSLANSFPPEIATISIGLSRYRYLCAFNKKCFSGEGSYNEPLSPELINSIKEIIVIIKRRANENQLTWPVL